MNFNPEFQKTKNSKRQGVGLLLLLTVACVGILGLLLFSKSTVPESERTEDSTVPSEAPPLRTPSVSNTGQEKLKTSLRYLAESRLSGLGTPLTWEEVHGHWDFTPKVFDKALSHPNAQLISASSPRVVLIKHFLSPEEVLHVLSLAADMERSEVVADDHNTDDSRTSYGAWLNGPRRDSIVRLIQHRIHTLIGVPEEFGESLYVLRYSLNQKYEAHTDHCSHSGAFTKQNLPDSCRQFLMRAGGPGCGPGKGGATCGDRLATFVMYLQAADKGGATVFPNAKKSGSFKRMLKDDPEEENGDIPWYCKEDADVLKVEAQAGDGILFWGYSPGDNATAIQDPASLHAGCPPLEGTKFIATRWIRSAGFQ